MFKKVKGFFSTKFPSAVATGIFITFCVAGAVFLYAAWTDGINQSAKAEGWQARQAQYEAEANLAKINNAEKKMAKIPATQDCQKVIFVAKNISAEPEKPTDSVEETTPGSSQELDPAYAADDLAKIEAIKEEIRQLQELQKLAAQDQTVPGIVQDTNAASGALVRK